jgi:hypothetical protein
MILSIPRERHEDRIRLTVPLKLTLRREGEERSYTECTEEFAQRAPSGNSEANWGGVEDFDGVAEEGGTYPGCFFDFYAEEKVFWTGAVSGQVFFYF